MSDAGGKVAPVSPAEIRAFWMRTRARLAAEPMAAVVEPLAEPLPHRKFRVALRSLDGVPICATLALPIQGDAPDRPWPAIITGPGYGGWQQGVMLSECQRGYAVLQLWPRSQGEAASLWKIDGPDKLTWRLENSEGAYYQGAYADMIRGVDFLASRGEVDPTKIAAVGTSQAGALVLALGALDPRIKAVVAHVPFLCDVRALARMPTTLVKKALDAAHRNDGAALRTLDHFDPLQLVDQLHAPTLLSSGGRDEICPAETIHAVADRIAGEKRLCHYPDLIHTSCTPFYRETWRWLERHLRSDT